jgi:hypothetical protein
MRFLKWGTASVQVAYTCPDTKKRLTESMAVPVGGIRPEHNVRKAGKLAYAARVMHRHPGFLALVRAGSLPSVICIVVRGKRYTVSTNTLTEV